MISARAAVSVAVLLLGAALVGHGVAFTWMGGSYPVLDTSGMWFFFDAHLYGQKFMVWGTSQISLIVVGAAAIALRPFIARWVFADSGDGQPFVANVASLFPIGLALAGVGLVVSTLLIVTAPVQNEGLGRGLFTIPDERTLFVSYVRGGVGAVFLVLAGVCFRRDNERSAP